MTAAGAWLLDGTRKMFYLVTPWELALDDQAEPPKFLLSTGLPMFFVLILVEVDAAPFRRRRPRHPPATLAIPLPAAADATGGPPSPGDGGGSARSAVPCRAHASPPPGIVRPALHCSNCTGSHCNAMPCTAAAETALPWRHV